MRIHPWGLSIVLLVAAIPAVSLAQMSIQSGHEAELLIGGDARGYTRVTAARPLVVEVEGPGELTVVLRQELEPDQAPGRTTTRASLLSGARVMESFRLRGEAVGAFERSAVRSRPTEAVEHKRDVPEGLHVFTIRVESSGHQILVSIGFVPDEDDLALMPLVPLTESEEAEDEIPLVALAPPGDEDEEELPLAGLVPPEDEGDAADTGREVRVASLTDDVEAPGETVSGAVVGKPLHDTPRAPRAFRMVLGMRGLAAATGMGGGTMGGGLDLLLDNGLLDGKLTFGVSADLVMYHLLIPRYERDGSIVSSNMTVQAIPIMGVASYVLPFALGPVTFQVIGGVGPVLTNVTGDTVSNMVVLPGGALSIGPRLDVGPGALSLAVRASGSHGTILDERGSKLIHGPIGGLGLTAGYIISI